jgi:hypothetical protein
MYVSKQGAQNNANDTAAAIRRGAAKNGVPASRLSCSPPSPVPPAPDALDGLEAACAHFNSDNSDVNTDATIGNIALGVGVVAAAATVVYWLVADKHEGKSDDTSASLTPVFTPYVGPGNGGFSLSGAF